MKILLLFTILLIGGTSITAQNPSGFDTECEKYISGTVPLAYSKELYRAINSPNVIILDAREEKEYEVSHLPKSQYIGFDNFDSKSVSLIKKQTRYISTVLLDIEVKKLEKGFRKWDLIMFLTSMEVFSIGRILAIR